MGGLTSICKGKIRKRKIFMTPCVLCAPSASTNSHVQPRRADPHAKRNRKHQKSCERQNRTWRRRACKGSSFSSRAGGERFCSLSQPNPKQYKAGVNNNKKLYLHFNIQFGFNQKNPLPQKKKKKKKKS